MKLSRKEHTAAISRYARLRGYYARTVRAVSALRYEAIREWKERASLERAEREMERDKRECEGGN